MKAEKTLMYSRKNTFGMGNTKTEKRKKDSVYKQKIIVTLFLFLFVAIGVLLTPVFNIKAINVSGNSYITTDKILETSTAKINKNIFLFTVREAEQRIGELSFTDTVEVKRVFPDEIYINIKECVPVSQIMCGQSLYIVIDKNGKILDTASEKEKYNVPVITDVEVDSFEVSKKVVFENEKDLEKILLLVEELYKDDALNLVTSLYIKNDELHAVFGGTIDCNFDSGDNLSYRVKFVKECLKKLKEGEKGTIHFMENYRAVFTREETGNEN